MSSSTLWANVKDSHPDVIITRDKKGFVDFGILVMTPTEFIRRVKE